MSIRNWANSQTIGVKSQVVKVVSVAQISALLKAKPAAAKVKVLGSGMSYQGIAAVDSKDDLLLDLSALTGSVHDLENQATFFASTTLQQVADILQKSQRQLVACPGVLLTQTIGGAIATGTHGQDMKSGGLYDAVMSLQVVLADGSVKTFSRSEDLNDAFHAFRLHLGALGIVTQVTFKTEPLQIYRLTKALTTFEDLQNNFQSWNATSEHTKAWWFPKTGDVQLWRTFGASQEEVTVYEKEGKKVYQIPESSSTYDKIATEFSRSIDVMIEKMDEDTKASSEIQTQDVILNRPKARFDTVLRFRNLQHCLGNMYQLWCKVTNYLILILGYSSSSSKLRNCDSYAQVECRSFQIKTLLFPIWSRHALSIYLACYWSI
jgi:FAD/FMN-containing dehydrogenase